MVSDARSELRKRMARNTSQPLLALSYKSAVLSVCGVPVKVGEKQYPKLKALQTRLDGKGVAYDTYGYTIVRVYWNFCKEHGMNLVPLKIFCGKAAWERFCNILDSTVEISSEHDEQWSEMVHKELSAAQMYIGAQIRGRAVTLSQMRKLAGQPEPSADVVAEAQRLLSESTGTKGTYDEMILSLIERRKK